MNLFKYFKFYYDLTEKRIITFLLLSFSAVGFQLVALFAVTSVTSFGNFNLKMGQITCYVFELLKYLGISDERSQFTALMAFALVTFCLSSAFFVLTVYYTAIIQSGIFVRSQKRLVGKLLDADYQFFMTKNVGFINNVVTIQIRQMSQSFKFYTNIITALLISSAYMFVPLVTNPKLVFIMGLTGIPMIFLIMMINRRTKQYSIESVEQQSSLNGILFQLVTNFKYLKSTETYPAVVKQHLGFSGNLAVLMRKLALLGALNEHGLLAYAVSFGIIMVAWQYLVMGVSIVESVTILGLLFVGVRKLSTIPSAYQKFLSVSGAILVCRQFEEELDHNPEKITVSGTEHPDFSLPVSFENVSFSYAAGEGTVLDDISLKIMPRSSVAFVGGSGAGKSTIVNLISGLLSPSSGRISLGGIDYRDLNIRELRKSIGYVTQEPVIFHDSVRHNISLWRDDLAEDEIIDAAGKAYADEFINEFTDGYDTLLGDNGMNISGGQRQRITIARELLRNTQILILDEATSALDSKTEHHIQQSIEKCRGEKTVIIIAHRLSTIKNCDKIFVLENGKLVEEGTYNELYNRNGRFRIMVDAQNMQSEAGV